MKKLTILTIILAFFAYVAFAGSEKKPEKSENSQIIYKAGSQKSFKGPENLRQNRLASSSCRPTYGRDLRCRPDRNTGWKNR